MWQKKKELLELKKILIFVKICDYIILLFELILKKSPFSVELKRLINIITFNWLLYNLFHVFMVYQKDTNTIVI